jgi:hypothetical protein
MQFGLTFANIQHELIQSPSPGFGGGQIQLSLFAAYETFSTGNWISVAVSGSVWLPFFPEWMGASNKGRVKRKMMAGIMHKPPRLIKHREMLRGIF